LSVLFIDPVVLPSGLMPPPVLPVVPPPLSPQETAANAKVRISAVIDMNLGREIGGGGGSCKSVSCHHFVVHRKLH
jgi:hypothetical protein